VETITRWARRARVPAMPAALVLVALALVVLALAFAPVGSAFAVFTKQVSVTANTLGTAASFPVCYRDAVLADTPVGYWRLDETSGTTAADSKGSNPGTYVNGPLLGQAGALPDAVNNRAASLDGVDDRIDVPASASLNVTSQITIEAWIYPTDTSSVHPIVEYADSTRYGVHLWQYDSGTKLFANVMDTGGNGHWLASAPVFTPNAWYQVALTYDGSVGVLYVNGTEVARAVLGAFTIATNLPVNIGRRPVVGDSLQNTVFAGKLDEVAIYPAALTATKIRSHYNTGRCYKDAALSDNPAGYWRLGESSGTTAADGVAGRHGTYVGGPTLGQTGALNLNSNTAVAFNGTSQYVRVPYSSALNPGAFTVEAWAKPNGGSQYRSVVSSLQDVGGGSWRGFWLGVNPGNTWEAEIGQTSGVVTQLIGPTARTGTWAHLSLTYDGTTAKLYVDGLLVASAATSYRQALVVPLTIGTGMYDASTASELFTGTVDEVAVYGSALSQSRVQAHYLVGRSYQDTVLDSGPVSYWRLGEVSGSSAADSKGSNTGTYTNAPILAQAGALAGDSDAAAGFDGTSSYVSVPYSATVNTAQFTVEGWAKWNGAGSGTWRTVAGTWNDSTMGGMWAGISTGGSWYVSTQGSGSSYSEVFGPAATSGTWVHLTATYDGSVLRLYVNGAEVGNVTPVNYVPQTSFPLGMGANRYAAGPGDYFGGVLDDVAVYDRALSAAEVQLHYDSGRQ
jgi:Concanavalin A-like lectin/glucanases superfamily